MIKNKMNGRVSKRYSVAGSYPLYLRYETKNLAISQF